MLKKKIESLNGTFTELNDDTKLKAMIQKRIKETSKKALRETLDIITNKESYNAELDKTLENTPYHKVNHCFNLVNNVLLANDLEKSVEKIITSITKVLLISKGVNFANFIGDLKDFDSYSKNATFLSDEDLANNDAFKARITVINGFFKNISDYNEGLVSKQARKHLGAVMVQISDLEEMSLIAFIKEYKVNRELKLEDFNILSNGYNKGLKAYYDSLNA